VIRIWWASLREPVGPVARATAVKQRIGQTREAPDHRKAIEGRFALSEWG
jgi:hypothetical protein